MDLNMKVVFHTGKDSPRYIRRFHEMRIDSVIGELRQYPASELRLARRWLIQQIDTDTTDYLMAA